jgi:glycosyltransferase involved in cell wall biosynthesis
MLLGKKIVVVMPAYNAEKTLQKTVDDLPREIVDEVILVDDCSTDRTVQAAADLNLKVFSHDLNHGYGRNQKTCYREALKTGGDIIIMVHPDYQYDPRLVLPMAGMIASGTYDVVIASRILGGGALKGGMPLYKYVFNRCLTLFQNLVMGCKLSEYHTGYRAFARDVLRRLPLEENSDNFVFDNQMLAQAVYFNHRVGEISCPTKYFEEASSIRFLPSMRYGLGVLATTFAFFLQKKGLAGFGIFDAKGRTLEGTYYSEVAMRPECETMGHSA